MPDPAHSPLRKPCPICGKPAAARFRPFCSKRCADIDLHRWLSGSYAVPAVENEAWASNDPDEPGSGGSKGEDR